MKQLLKELALLFLITWWFFPLIGIIGIIYTFIKHICKLDYSLSKQLAPIVRVISLLTDCFANAGAGELLNDILKVAKDAKIKYGCWYQTISAVTGLRFLFDKKDNKFRKSLDKTLGTGHCVDAISIQDKYYYKNNNL